MAPGPRRNRVPGCATRRHHDTLLAVLLVLVCWHLSAVHGTNRRTLRIRSLPTVDGVSSSLYEVYMAPYFFEGPVVAARAVLSGSNTEAEGQLILEQAVPPFGAVAVRGNASGLPPGIYTLYVTLLGDLRDGCDNLEPVYSPYQVSGEPGVLANLGGLSVGDDGKAALRLLVPDISLTGPRGVAGRGLLLRKEPPGAAAICGAIAYTMPHHPHQSAAPGGEKPKDSADKLTA